jgi:hypothetical protein
MAELNFGLLTPPGSQSIGNAFVTGMDQAAVARAQENQNALSQYTLAKAKREDELTNQLLGDLRSATTNEDIYRAYQRAGKPDVASKMQSERLTQDKLRGDILAQPGDRAYKTARTPDRLLTPKEEEQRVRIVEAGRAPNTTAYTNVQPDGNGGYIGLSKKTGQMAKIPQDANVVAGGRISGDALELAAQGYLMDRKLPTNLGRGKQGAMNTIKIMERAAALAKESGMTADETAINQITAKAKSGALAQNVKDLAAIRPYNAMLEKNGDIAISLAEKAISTNAKLANRSINWLKQNASDNPDVAEFLAQARIFTTESARVLNNPRLVGQLTDSARHEMDGIINGDMPLDSFTRVVRRLQSDGKNRVDAMVEESNLLQQSIRRPNAAGQSTAPAAAAGIPQAAIDALNAGAGTAEQFDAQFGAGSAARVRGGINNGR